MADSLIRNRPRYVGLSDRGRLRAENQDRWIGHEKLGLFAVADGMGGQAAGGLASKVVIDALPSIVRKVAPSVAARFPAAVPAELCSQLSTLSALLFEEAAGRPGLEGMGSTLAMVLVRGDQAIVAHLGDSRVYRYRNGELETTHSRPQRGVAPETERRSLRPGTVGEPFVAPVDALPGHARQSSTRRESGRFSARRPVVALQRRPSRPGVAGRDTIGPWRPAKSR